MLRLKHEQMSVRIMFSILLVVCIICQKYIGLTASMKANYEQKEILQKSKGRTYGNDVERIHSKHRKNNKINYLAEELESIKKKLKEARRKKKNRQMKKKKGEGKCNQPNNLNKKLNFSLI